MTITKRNEKTLSLKVTEGLQVTILPSTDHEFLMSTKQVSFGYGVSEQTIRGHKHLNCDELIDEKHFIRGVRISNSEPHNKVYWTKRGIVRLGFFIKSQRAKLFRDWAEDLIISEAEKVAKAPEKTLPVKRKHNRLTSERLLSIMVDVAKIENKKTRLSITNKLLMV